MGRPPRKEREIRAREEAILETARQILLDEGFAAISMDRIAKAIEYSRGTVYQHFGSKEDVLAGLVQHTYARRTALFERAATFRGSARERVLAIGVADDLFVRTWPDHFRAEQIVLLTAHDRKLENERVQSIESWEQRCFQIVTGLVRDGIAAGDLELPDGRTPELVTFGLWSVSFGSHFIGHTLGRYGKLGFEGSVWDAIRLNVNSMLDGLGWRPLWSDEEWRAAERRVQNEIFREEFEALSDAS